VTGGWVTLVMKATRQCNLRCAYCGDRRDGSRAPMSFAVVARTIHRALREHDRVEFIWHGGEAALLPVSFYRKAMLVQARFRRPGQAITNTFQTNGTLLDDEWARFLREARFRVGLSIDGPPEVHDRTRPYAGGAPSFDHVRRGIQVLREHGVPVGCVLVISDEVLEFGAARIFEFFARFEVRSYSCLPVKAVTWPGTTGLEGRRADPNGTGRFLCDLHDCWLAHGDRRILIRELDAVRDALCGREPQACYLSGNCIGHYYCVEPEGDVTHCGSFVGRRYPLGNILDSTFAQLTASESMARLVADNQRSLVLARARCQDVEVTRGGCPYDRLVADADTAPGPCCPHHNLVAHVRASIAAEQASLHPS
jgi:uncharacterized protein